MATAVVRAIAVSGAKGNNRAVQLFTQMIKVVGMKTKNFTLATSPRRSTTRPRQAWTDLI